MALAALACRADIEPDRDAGSFHQDLVRWLASAGVAGELEAEESRVVEAPLGSLTPQETINAGWRCEGLVVLAWALRQIELPPHDQQLPAASVARPMGFMDASPAVFQAPRLRSREDLQSCAERMFAIHWRLRQFSLDGRPIDFVTLARKAWFGPLDVGGLPFIEQDLAIRGVALTRSPHWREVLSIAMERHQAANWLIGYDPVYSEVGTDT